MFNTFFKNVDNDLLITTMNSMSPGDGKLTLYYIWDKEEFEIDLFVLNIDRNVITYTCFIENDFKSGDYDYKIVVNDEIVRIGRCFISDDVIECPTIESFDVIDALYSLQPNQTILIDGECQLLTTIETEI